MKEATRKTADKIENKNIQGATSLVASTAYVTQYVRCTRGSAISMKRHERRHKIMMT